jgi:histidine triad (HIT) family protein
MTALDCLFCKIVARKIPSSVVFESDAVLGFKDVNPQAPVHVLFVPKRHIDGVDALGADDASVVASLTLAANQTALELGVLGTGYRLVINNKKDAGQAVDHLHLHLLGGRRLAWPPG